MNRYIKKVVREPFEIIDFIISYWPGTTGRILRTWLIAKKLQNIGINPSIGIGVVITGGGDKNWELFFNYALFFFIRP